MYSSAGPPYVERADPVDTSASLPRPHTAMTSFPAACPASSSRIASGVSLSA
jgi:hypothetical protein